jgi:hypothetical protein
MIIKAKIENIHLNTKQIFEIVKQFLIYKESERGEKKSPRAAYFCSAIGNVFKKKNPTNHYQLPLTYMWQTCHFNFT